MVPPNVAMFVLGRVTRQEIIGLSGVCSGHNMFLRKGLLLVKSVVTISTDFTVPIKIINPSTEPIDNTFTITPLTWDEPKWNVQV